jgi:hypothetical protein
LDRYQCPAFLLDRDDVSFLYKNRRNVDRAAVQNKMTVRRKLSCLLSGCAKTDSIDDVVEPPLEELQEIFACTSFFLGRSDKISPELSLQESVDPF